MMSGTVRKIENVFVQNKTKIRNVDSVVSGLQCNLVSCLRARFSLRFNNPFSELCPHDLAGDFVPQTHDRISSYQ